MTANIPKKAFVLAAGLGERMRPLTNNCPKPLLYVGGRTMLDRALDALAEAGVEDAVVNTHYLAEMIENHLATRRHPRVTIAREEKLLDTGGGVLRQLEFFGDESFYVLNADIVWTDGPEDSALRRLAAAWDPSRMDLLLLLHPVRDLPAYNGIGDYYLAPGDDRPVFAKNGAVPGVEANCIFAGPRIVHPRLFAGEKPGHFSFLDLFHKAEKAGRLAALVHDGAWHHVGTPEALEKTNLQLAAQQKIRAT